MSDDKGRSACAVADHYHRPELIATLLDAAERAGKTIRTYQDTAAFDEFHIRGREATRELARLAGLSPGMRVLDLGCGLGGPARLMAAEFGCIVTGIDLMTEFVEAANRLTAMVGLTPTVSFRQGDMLSLDVDDNSFDAVWSQHALMNIADKQGLLRRIHRMLVPGGVLAVYEVLAGSVSPRHYPVPWAGDGAIDHLVDTGTLKAHLSEAGFSAHIWQDTTASCLEWFEAVQHKVSRHPSGGSPSPGIHLVLGPAAPAKAKNVVRNLREDRIRVVYGVLKKGAA